MLDPSSHATWITPHNVIPVLDTGIQESLLVSKQTYLVSIKV
ncbi:MAG: hypothetical protein ACEY3B_00430 [Wolbachia sp.]|nr:MULTISPECIES: hypothetical protein [Wolbachia]UVW83878.1 hypothetical protein NHG98_06050 [Wolbachia endosymbiont of Aedes albopictus]